MNVVEKLINLPPALDHFGYLIILLFTLLEGAPLVGFFIPGQLMIMAAGFMARMNVFGMKELILITVMGAVIGDSLGYFLGKKYGYSFIAKYGKYFLFNHNHYEKTKKLMEKHTGKTLIIGRIHSFTRAITPFIAGVSKIKFLHFLFYDFIGSVLWAVVFVSIGYLSGESYAIVAKSMGQITSLILIVTLLTIFVYRFVNKRKTLLTKENVEVAD